MRRAFAAVTVAGAGAIAGGGQRRFSFLDPAYVVILAGVSAALHMTKLIPALPVIQRELALSLVEAGFLLSAIQVTSMVLGLLIGLMADRYGARRGVMAGLAVLVVASVLPQFSGSVTLLMASRALEGFGFLLVSAPAPGLIRRLVGAARMGRLLGIWSSYIPFATALALLGGPFVILWASWQMLWLVLAVLSLLVGLAVWWLVPADPAQRGDSQPVENLGPRLRLTLRSPGPWLVALCFSVYSAQWLAVIGFLPTLYAQAGIASAWAAVLTALVAGVNIIGNLMSGRLLANGRSAPSLLYIGFAVMAASTVLAYADFSAWLDANSLAALRFGALLMFSMVAGIVPGTLFSLAVRLAPSEGTAATTVGWMLQWSSLGQFAGPPAAAWVASHSGGWQWTWLVTGLCALTGFWLARQISALLQRRR